MTKFFVRLSLLTLTFSSAFAAQDMVRGQGLAEVTIYKNSQNQVDNNDHQMMAKKDVVPSEHKKSPVKKLDTISTKEE